MADAVATGAACLRAGIGGVGQHALHVLRAALCAVLQLVGMLHLPARQDEKVGEI